MALLRVLSGENKNKIFALEAEKMVIGRESDQIAVLDQGVSRNHAEVFRIGELYFIRDLKSRNGTFVNDSRIEDPELLRAGDRVHLGNTVLAFEDQFPRPHDSRVIHLQDTTDTPASTLSFRLPVKDESSAEPAPPDAQEHARLQTLYTVSRLLGTGESLSETMDSVAREMCRALNANHVYLFAFKEKDDGEEEFQLVAGHDEQPAEGMMLSRSVLRRVRAEGRPILSSDAMLDDRFAANQSIVIKKIKSLLCVPLLVMNNPIGAFYATNDKVAEAFSAEDLELATTIGMLVGNSLEMWETLEREGSFYRNVLKTIAAATEVRTPENRGKAERVANHAAAMAGALGFSDKRTRRLWIAGLLHDIGAMALTEDELKNAVNLEQRKAKHAGELLERIPELSEVAPAIRYHTERIDGSGFPEGRKADEIPVEAQMVGLACAFDEILTHGGEDGGELRTKEALMRIRDLAGQRFSPGVANSLLIAYRRNILFKEDEQLFARGL